MIFESRPVAEATGTILAHSQIVGGQRWAKGRRLSRFDVAAAQAAGIDCVTVAALQAGDVGEDAAAARFAAALAGKALAALVPVHGRVNLVADAAGLLRVDAESINHLNAIDEALTIATRGNWARLRIGEIAATIKVIPYAVPVGVLDAALTAAKPLSVTPFRTCRVDLIATTTAGMSAKQIAKTDVVTRSRLAALGSVTGPSLTCAHNVDALADLLRKPTDAAIILIAGASATVDRGDVIPAAILAAGGRIERLGMPVDPGNLLCLGYIGQRAIVGLPGCARSPKRNGFDWVLERLVAGIDVDSASIAAMGNGGLLAEIDRPEPRSTRTAQGLVGAIVLAAGRSTRMGAANKLLADLGGKPLVAHVVDTLAAAGLPPPVVVLGNMAEEVRAALSSFDVQFVRADDYAEGLSRSLRAGLAAVPGDWRGVLVCLGDMPLVSVGTVQALVAAAADPAVVAIPVWSGKRGNPVLWGRSHFERLATLDGDVGGKALLAEIGDAVIEVAADTDGVLADVDTPEALAAMRKAFSPRAPPPARA